MLCSRCKGKKTIFVVDRIFEHMGYGPDAQGHYEECPDCHGTGLRHGKCFFCRAELVGGECPYGCNPANDQSGSSL